MLSKIAVILKFVKQLMSNAVQLHFHSTPNFVIEIIIWLVLYVIHGILIREIGIMIKKVDTKSKFIRRQSAADVKERSSNPLEVIRTHPDLGIDVLFNDNYILKNEYDTMTKINKLLSTSMTEFIKCDHEYCKEDYQNLFDEKIKDQKQHCPPFYQNLEKGDEPTPVTHAEITL